MKYRVGAVGIVENSKGEILLCKMPKDRGVYPGQWGIPGGGIEEGETMEEALVREVKEEVGLDVMDIEPFYFQDDVRDKLIPGKPSKRVFMIHLIFDCKVANDKVVLNQEFEEYVWVQPENVGDFDLGDASVKTFKHKGWL